MALLKAREASMRLFRPMLADNDLTEQQWRVLRSLSSVDEPLSVGQVADHTFLLGPSLSRILSNLEGRGLIERSTVEHDQRRANLTLTDYGRTTVRDVAPESEAIYNHIESQFGAERLAALLDELAALEALGPADVRDREAS